MSCEFVLHGFPGSCSIVPQIALEEAGADYRYALTRIDLGEHVRPAFLALNPWAKVPVLEVHGHRLAEIPAITRYLDTLYPEAGLMPRPDDPLRDAISWSVLSWCSSTLHPLVTRVRRPAIFAGEPHAEAVWAIAAKQLGRQLALADRRLEGSPWMLGSWSVVDAYLLFIVAKAEEAGIDVGAFRAIAAHTQSMRSRPSVERALATEHLAAPR